MLTASAVKVAGLTAAAVVVAGAVGVGLTADGSPAPAPSGGTDALAVADRHAVDVDATVQRPARERPADRCRSTPATGRVVLVDLSDQRMWLCRDRREVLTTPVTTGKDATPTRPGRWHVIGRQSDKVIRGPGYARHVEHWMPYFQGYGFHDSAWQRFPYGDDEARRERGSHGCVRVPRAAMRRLFAWAPLGTAVRITR